MQNTPENIEEFKYDVEYVEELITRILNPYTKESLQKKYVNLFYKAKKVPVSRAQSFDIFKNVVLKTVDEVIDTDEKVRKDLGAMENLGFEEVPEEQTEEEAAAALAELQNRKAEALKKTKAKPKTEEEEAAELEQVIAKTSEELGKILSTDNGDTDVVKAAEKEIELIKTRWIMENHTKMDADQYDCINRKLSVYDIELGAKDVVLRLDLDIPLSKFTPPVKQANEGISAKSLEKPAESVGRDSKVNAKKSKESEIDSAISGNPLGNEED